jgi:predicted  nucleic acid-binding Zn-ribbon protein
MKVSMMMLESCGHVPMSSGYFGRASAWRRVMILSCGLLLGMTCLSTRAETAAEKRKSLAAELERVQTELTAAQTNLAHQAKAIWDRQHDLEYNKPECAALREEIKTLEKQLIEKRRLLDEKMALQPEMKEIRKDRQELFEKLQKLKDDERLLMNEIMAIDNGAFQENP